MNRKQMSIGVAGLAITAFVGGGLSAVAPASAAVVGADTYANVNLDDDAGCDLSQSGGSSSNPWSDNGAPVTSTYSVSGTSIDTGNDPTDITDLKGASTTTVRATTLGVNAPGRISVSGSASASANPRLGSAATGCEAEASAYSAVTGNFTLAAPMWATITASGDVAGTSAGGYVQVYETSNGNGGFYVPFLKRGSGAASTLLPAGDYSIDIEFWANVYGPDPDAGDRSSAVSGSTTINLAPLGHPSAVAGKAKGTVVLGARNCTTGAVSASLTKKARKKAKSVVVTVNGKKAAKFAKKKLKAKAILLPVARTAPANVVATVTLKNGKKLTLSRSYLAC